MPKKDGSPHVTFDAPIVPLSYVLPEEGVEIHTCNECYPWSVDVGYDDEHQVTITEWHAAECAFVQRWLEENSPC